MQYIFIPSYHRPENLKTVYTFEKLHWDMSKIVVFVDSEADDIEEYRAQAEIHGFRLEVFDMDEARERYDYVHRPSKARRSAGQARNMFQDYAKRNGIDFYIVQDDDTQGFQYRKRRIYEKCTEEQIKKAIDLTEAFMRKRKIGLFGWLQTGDLIGGDADRIYLRKVMNMTFYLLPYIYRGERGVQDDDTSMFTGVMNAGLFTGSTGMGCCLSQMASATQKGGLTDLYRECKLMNKALVTVIQYPSAIHAEKQELNGGRLHHRINNRYLYPRIIKTSGKDNIAWDTYEEDIPFTNEPNRQWKEKRTQE